MKMWRGRWAVLSFVLLASSTSCRYCGGSGKIIAFGGAPALRTTKPFMMCLRGGSLGRAGGGGSNRTSGAAEDGRFERDESLAGSRYVKILLQDGNSTAEWNVSVASPLSDLLARYESGRETVVRMRHDLVGQRGELLNSSLGADALGIVDGQVVLLKSTEVPHDPSPVLSGAGAERQRASKLGSPYANKLSEWLSRSMNLRGGGFGGLEDHRAGHFGGLEVHPTYQECDKEMQAAGDFAPFLKEYLNVTNEEPQYTAGPYALLLSESGEAGGTKFMFANDWFCRVVNKSREELAGCSWSSIFENATAMKQRYWQLVFEEPSGLATRFPYLHPRTGEEILLAIHAEPIVYWFETERVHIVAVSINDITGFEEGISSRDRDPSEAELDFTDTLMGAGNARDTMHRKTVQSNFDFMQHVVFNAKTAACDALLNIFPMFENYTTARNNHMRWQKEWHLLKGDMPDFSDRAAVDQDDIHTENVDELCAELGEWYRDYRKENLELIAKREAHGEGGEEGDDGPKGPVDTCAEPPTTAPNDSSLEIARRMMREAARDAPEAHAARGTFEHDGLQLPTGTRSRMVDDNYR